jgi:hypothetical protein
MVIVRLTPWYFVYTCFMRNGVDDQTICQVSDGISDNEWLESGEKLWIGGMVFARGILGVAAEWFAGITAKGVYGVLYSNPSPPSFKNPQLLFALPRLT